MSKTCAAKQIRIPLKTASAKADAARAMRNGDKGFQKVGGKVFRVFTGRPAGSEAHGGSCKPKSVSASARKHRNLVGRTAAHCAKTVAKPTAGEKKNWKVGRRSYMKRVGTCVRNELAAPRKLSRKLRAA